jgi:hypothetical protein
LTAARWDRVGAEQRRVEEGGACSVTRGAGIRSRAAGSADPAAGVQAGTKIPGTISAAAVMEVRSGPGVVRAPLPGGGGGRPRCREGAGGEGLPDASVLRWRSWPRSHRPRIPLRVSDGGGACDGGEIRARRRSCSSARRWRRRPSPMPRGCGRGGAPGRFGP